MERCASWKKEQSTGAQYLVKTFELDSFEQLHTFLQRISTAGDALGHHMDTVGASTMTLTGPGWITIKYSTKDEGMTVTELDYLLAAVTDRIYKLLKAEYKERGEEVWKS